MNNIPNIIHQTWKSKTDLPKKFSIWRKSFIELNPNFEVKLYDDVDNRNIVLEHLPQLLNAYDSFPREIYRVDFVRALYLFFYGGIYADMDTQCLKSLDRYLDLSGVYLAQMGNDNSFEHSIPNAIMASSKNSAFWIFFMLKMIELSANADKTHAPEYVTGPVALRNSVFEYNHNINLSRHKIANFISTFNLNLNINDIFFSTVNVLDYSIWYPLNWNDYQHQEIRKQILTDELFFDKEIAIDIFPNSEMVTYWSHTWNTNK